MSLDTYEFYWLDGKIDRCRGIDAQDALTRLGYGGGAIRALDYFKQIVTPPAVTAGKGGDAP